MELTRLKGRLRTAQRGHKLLKDKRDELMKQFMEVVREDLALRQKVEQSLARAYGSFTVASALMSPEMLEQALLCPKQSVSLETGTENVMSVEVPRYEFKLASEDGGNIYPYASPRRAASSTTRCASSATFCPTCSALPRSRSHAAARRRDRAHETARQRARIRQNSADAAKHQVYHDEAR
mgnify:CR=1 FL=1